MLQMITEKGQITRIYDNRYPESVDITDGTGRFGYLAYTLHSQDINKEEKPRFVPFREQYAGFDENGCNSRFDSRFAALETENGVELSLSCEGEDVDGTGIYLPFNFISRKNGVWMQQFTVSSPCRTENGHTFVYLKRPDGRHLVCIAGEPIDGYQINYSDYSYGHFIRGITFWIQKDRAYGTPRRASRSITVRIAPAESFRDALEQATKFWDMPALMYRYSATKVGESFAFDPVGQWDEILVTAPSGKTEVLHQPEFAPEEYGFYKAVPYPSARTAVRSSVNL